MSRPKISFKILVPVLIGLVIIGFLVGRRIWKAPFRYAGTLEATQIDLPSRVAAVVDTIDVNEGQKIEKGQTLATLSCEELQISGRLARENFERAQRLRRAGSVSQETFDQLRSTNDEAKTRLSWCWIRSPVTGTVLTRFLEPKEWANPGTKVLAVADLRDIWAYIYVPQEMMSRLRVGARVRGIIPELGEKTFQGEIRKINDEAEFTPKNVQTQAERTRLVFGVKIGFVNTDGLLKPGMTIEVPLED